MSVHNAARHYCTMWAGAWPNMQIASVM